MNYEYGNVYFRWNKNDSDDWIIYRFLSKGYCVNYFDVDIIKSGKNCKISCIFPIDIYVEYEYNEVVIDHIDGKDLMKEEYKTRILEEIL